MPLVPAVLFQVFLWWSLALAVAVVLASCTSWFKLSATSEILLTIATLCVCGALTQRHSPFAHFEEWVGVRRDLFLKGNPYFRYDILLVLLMPGLLLIGYVIAIRASKRRAVALMAGLLWAVVVGGAFYALMVQPNIRLHHRDGPPAFPPGQILITRHVEIVRALEVPIVGLLLGVYATRRKHRPWLLVLIATAGAVGAHAIFCAFLPWWDWRSLLTVALSGFFVGLAASMPGQRSALAHHLSLQWDSEPPAPVGRATRLLRGVIVGTLGIAMVLLVVLNRMEAEVIHMHEVGPREDRSVRVGKNAYDVLFDTFGSKELGPYRRWNQDVANTSAWEGFRPFEWKTIEDPALVGVVERASTHAAAYEVISAEGPVDDRRHFTDIVRRQIRAEASYYEAYTAALEHSMDMPTLSPYRQGSYRCPNIIALREVSRCLARQSVLALYENDWRTALDLIEPILALGCQMHDGDLTIQLIGAQVRDIAAESLYRFWLNRREDPEALARAPHLMEKYGARARPTWPMENLSHYEYQFRPVVVFFDLWGHPDTFSLSHTIFLRDIAHYDQVELAIALDRYWNDHGLYPETLDEMAGVYIQKIPVSPFDGQRYIYRPYSRFFELAIPTCPVPDEYHLKGFPFPPGRKDKRK
jgi:hypothetical protein